VDGLNIKLWIKQSHVFLTNGKEVICDYVHRGKTDYLCIKEEVVISEITKSSIFNIDFIWEKNELENARKQSQKSLGGTCSWYEKEEIFEDYVAFGSTQKHYIFCSEKCQRSFRKQYPSRIHRNCYETDSQTNERSGTNLLVPFPSESQRTQESIPRPLGRKRTAKAVLGPGLALGYDTFHFLISISAIEILLKNRSRLFRRMSRS